MKKLLIFVGLASFYTTISFANIVLPPTLQLLENFDTTKGTFVYNGPKSTVKIECDTKDKIEGAASLLFSFSNNDWVGVGKGFAKPKKFDITSALYFVIKGDGKSTKMRVELTDDDGERFENIILIDFSGWKAFQIPFKSFHRRQDWQPDKAPNNGLNLTAVEAIAFSPVTTAIAIWKLDALGIIP